MIKYLVTKDSKGKFRFFNIECDETWHEPEQGYIIQRSYGSVGGKISLSPAIIVNRTKQKRNWKEQYTLQFNSEVKKQLDKGYKELSKDANEYSLEELDNIFGETVTDTNYIIRPMLAKQYDKVTNSNIFEKSWLASRKLDGVRALFYYKNGEIHTASRGGTHYDYSTTHLRNYEPLIHFFKAHPNVILDGELFKRFKSLQEISGAARMELNAVDFLWLEYWVYDCYIPEMSAIDRVRFLYENLKVSIYEGEDNDEPVKLLEHQPISGFKNIMELHDKYVSEGFEGVVIRDPDKFYKPNGRTNDMIKVKKYQSSEFKVIGYKLGLRGSEDMTFTCELEDGRTFEAMPVGSREIKQEYVDNFEAKYKNHLAECTYFNFSDSGIPVQPRFRVFRFDLE